MKTEAEPSPSPSATTPVLNPYHSPTPIIKKRSASPTPLSSSRALKHPNTNTNTITNNNTTNTTNTATTTTTTTKTLLKTLKSLLTQLESTEEPHPHPPTTSSPWTTTALTLLKHADQVTNTHLTTTTEVAFEVQELRSQAMGISADVKALNRKLLGLVRGIVEVEEKVWGVVDRDPGVEVREVVGRYLEEKNRGDGDLDGERKIIIKKERED